MLSRQQDPLIICQVSFNTLLVMQSKLPQSWVVKKNMINTSDGDDEEEYSEPSAKQSTLQWSRVKNLKQMLGQPPKSKPSTSSKILRLTKASTKLGSSCLTNLPCFCLTQILLKDWKSHISCWSIVLVKTIFLNTHRLPPSSGKPFQIELKKNQLAPS